MANKLQRLISTWPPGAVRSVRALQAAGYSQSLLARYRSSGWLESVGDGAVSRVGETPTIVGGLYALQKDLKLEVHIGARSALELLGRAHYVRTGRPTVTLFGEPNKLPKWFTTYDWGVDVEYHRAHLFDPTYVGLKKYQDGYLSVLISDEIRAMAEFLSLVPTEYSLEEGKDLMQGLTSLQPKKVEAMLHACKSIKVKRLFLVLVEESGYAWSRKLDTDSIDLGVGPRNLTIGGVMHKKYKITVPRAVLRERVE